MAFGGKWGHADGMSMLLSAGRLERNDDGVGHVQDRYGECNHGD